MNGDSDGNTGASPAAHITGADETGAFLTDQPPAADTPATGSRNPGINTTSANIAEPSDEKGDAVLARVTLGMVVMDVNGEQAGTVGGVQFAGTDILPEAPLGIAEDLVDTGYVLIDGAGHLANDAYAGGDQIDDVSDVVTLNVRRLDLIRVESTTA
jgi:hypothetical protein